jgi:ureidoacrylate peracid hydrolase
MSRNALLVIDVQNVYTSEESEMFCGDSKGTVKRINLLITHFADENRPVVLVRHIHKADGSDLGRMFDFAGKPEEDFNFKDGTPDVQYDASLLIPPGAIQIVKNRYSAFVGTRLHDILKKHGIDTVTICGFMTNFCCESTARQAHDLDYFVDFVVDATGTPGTDKFDEKEVRSIVSDILSAGYARVTRTSTLLRRASKVGER